MKPVALGLIVAAFVVAAFVLGGVFAERSDGPAEDLGEKIDNVATQ